MSCAPQEPPPFQFKHPHTQRGLEIPHSLESQYLLITNMSESEGNFQHLSLPLQFQNICFFTLSLSILYLRDLQYTVQITEGITCSIFISHDYHSLYALIQSWILF